MPSDTDTPCDAFEKLLLDTDINQVIVKRVKMRRRIRGIKATIMLNLSAATCYIGGIDCELPSRITYTRA